MRFRVILLLSLFPFLLADAPTTSPTTVPTTAPISLTWDQAKSHLNAFATVTGPVVGTHLAGSAIILNIGQDYPSPSRFTVYIPAAAAAAFPTDRDQGKTISVTGVIKLYHNLPEIQATPTDITIVAAPATQP